MNAWNRLSIAGRLTRASTGRQRWQADDRDTGRCNAPASAGSIAGPSTGVSRWVPAFWRFARIAVALQLAVDVPATGRSPKLVA
jgi:hypothetical protein